MSRKRSFESGFTILEIIIALSLLALLSGTIFRAFTSIRPVTPDQSTKAYNVTREALESMYEDVRYSDWNASSNPLNLGNSNQPFGAAVNLDGVNYQCFYTVSSVDADADGQEDYRKAEGVVSW